MITIPHTIMATAVENQDHAQDHFQDHARDYYGHGLSTTLINYILPNLAEYNPIELATELNEIFSNGIMFRMTEDADDVLYRIASDEGTVEETQALMDFMTGLAHDTPQRFIEMLQFDTLYTLNTDRVYRLRGEQPSQESREYLEREATRLEQRLMIVRPPRTTERYRLEYEAYQENEETRHRFVLVYQM